MFLAPTPAKMPAFSFLLADMAGTPAQVARHLGVTHRTLQRWVAAGDAPRSALLAMYWESRWGRSAMDAQLVNDARIAHGLVSSLQSENATLRARIARLERLGGFGSANGPMFYRAAFQEPRSVP